MDSSLLLGLAAAIGASVLFNTGLALQALDARTIPAEHSLKLSLIGRLIRHPRWLIGTAMTIIGWMFQALALLVAPLAVVQPALAAGLILLLVIGARHLHERVGPREIGGVLAIVVGVSLLTVVAPEHSDHVDVTGVVLVLGLLSLLVLVPFALYRGGGRRPGMTIALAAGCGYAFGGITTKLFSDALADQQWVALLAWAVATGCGSGLGFLNEMTALQRLAATRVAPLVFSVQLLIPVLFAPLLVGESWSETPLGGAVLVALVLLVCVGAAVVSSSKAVGELVAQEVER